MDNARDAQLIIEAVAKFYDLAPEDLIGRMRTSRIAYARQVAMFCIRWRLGLGLGTIAQLFNRDHPTVVHACKTISNVLAAAHSERQRFFELCDSAGFLPIARSVSICCHAPWELLVPEGQLTSGMRCTKCGLKCSSIMRRQATQIEDKA